MSERIFQRAGRYYRHALEPLLSLTESETFYGIQRREKPDDFKMARSGDGFREGKLSVMKM